MKRIVIANTKGGTGKTTSSIFLASALTAQGSVEVWDADPQGSASEWALRAEERDQALGFEVRPVNAAQLRRGSSSADFVVVDTGPGDWKVLDEALKLADLAILPTAPSPIDLDRFWETEQIASQLTRTYALITQADRRTKSLEQTVEALEASEVKLFATKISTREGIRRSFGYNPASDLGEYQAVADELLEVLQMSAQARNPMDDFGRRTRSGSVSMKQTMNRTGDIHADDPMVHLTIQIPESLRDQIKDAAKLERISTRLWVTDAIQRKMDDLGD